MIVSVYASLRILRANAGIEARKWELVVEFRPNVNLSGRM